jgi:hypothetical protein
VACKVCNKLVTNLRCSGHQPTRPTLLKRKRTASEDEVSHLYRLCTCTTNFMERSTFQKLTVALLVKLLVYYRMQRFITIYDTIYVQLEVQLGVLFMYSLFLSIS